MYGGTFDAGKHFGYQAMEGRFFATCSHWCGSFIRYTSPIEHRASPHFFSDLSTRAGASQYVEIILKGLGIVILTQICSDICKDSGEGTLAGHIETLGKLELLLLCIPLIEEILGTAERLLEMGG